MCNKLNFNGSRLGTKVAKIIFFYLQQNKDYNSFSFYKCFPAPPQNNPIFCFFFCMHTKYPEIIYVLTKTLSLLCII